MHHVIGQYITSICIFQTASKRSIAEVALRLHQSVHTTPTDDFPLHRIAPRSHESPLASLSSSLHYHLQMQASATLHLPHQSTIASSPLTSPNKLSLNQLHYPRKCLSLQLRRVRLRVRSGPPESDPQTSGHSFLL